MDIEDEEDALEETETEDDEETKMETENIFSKEL